MFFRELAAIGAVPESRSEELIDLLRKICGSSGQDFSIYEAVLRIQSKIQTEARLMCYCGNGKSNWTFRVDGAPKRERDKMELPAAIRDIREVAVEENAFSFLTAMGYELSYEILRKGESFVLVGKKDLMIRVSKLFKLEVARDVSSAKLLDPSVRVIEVTSPTDESYMEGMDAIEKLAAQIVG